MIVIALLVPVVMLLLLLALDALEDLLFPPAQPPRSEDTIPEQSASE